MKLGITFLIIFLTLGIWGFLVEPYLMTVKKIKIKDESLKGLKIVFATDFHYKPYEKFRLVRDVKKINKQNADIILLGGDFLNGHEKGKSMDSKLIASEFGKLKSKYGVYAIFGNHDVWQDAAGVYENFTKNNITILKNTSKKAGEVYIAGVEDIQTQNPDIKKALKNTKTPTILLTHSPDIIYKVPKSVNLTLAGHLHGGQVRIPFHGAVVAPSIYGTKFAYGMYNVDNRKLFVSKGIGTSVIPVRFFCLPEIVVIEFI